MLFALIAALSFAAPALPMGSVYGKIAVKPSYFLGQPANGFARRLGLPPVAAREPAGVLVTLEGALLDKEKFDPATDEVPVRIADGGFSVSLIGGMIGTKLVVENNSDRGLSFAGAPFLKDMEAKAKKTITLDTAGVYTITEPSMPGAKLTVVVTTNPYVIALDETGEFLFESLEVGPYTLKIFTRDRAVSAPLQIKANERTDLVLPLAKADKQKTADKPAESPGKP
jgi:hypothetical protein